MLLCSLPHASRAPCHTSSSIPHTCLLSSTYTCTLLSTLYFSPTTLHCFSAWTCLSAGAPPLPHHLALRLVRHPTPHLPVPSLPFLQPSCRSAATDRLVQTRSAPCLSPTTATYRARMAFLTRLDAFHGAPLQPPVAAAYDAVYAACSRFEQITQHFALVRDVFYAPAWTTWYHSAARHSG